MAGEKTPIYNHLFKRRPESIQTLLDLGMTPNERYYSHAGARTPVLFYAIDTNHVEAIALLLAYGADTNLKDDIGQTALYRSIKSGNIEIVKAIITAKAELDTDVHGNGTTLHEACRMGFLEAAIALKHAGAKINMLTNEGNTELHDSVRYGRPIMVQWLLKQEGIQIDLRNKEDHCAYDYSSMKPLSDVSIEALELCQMALDKKLKALYKGEEAKGFADKFSKKTRVQQL